MDIEPQADFLAWRPSLTALVGGLLHRTNIHQSWPPDLLAPFFNSPLEIHESGRSHRQAGKHRYGAF
jgi:hypothetical protein